MTEKYPIPDYAVNLWVAGDDLLVAFPGQGPAQQGHTIRLLASAAGLATAIKILKDRSLATDLRLNTKGTPSQWDLAHDARYRAWGKALAEAKAAKATEKAEAEAFLAELDL